MWTYNKMLEYPINIKCTDPKLAKFIISQYGGPDGELAASLRYLSQRFGMPDQKSKAVLNDIGTEELAHLEMVGTIVHQLTKDASIEEIEKAGLGAYYTDHGVDVYPSSAADVPSFRPMLFSAVSYRVVALFIPTARSFASRQIRFTPSAPSSMISSGVHALFNSSMLLSDS